MVREDRQLRLAGYEIYRFGGHEFLEDQDPATMLRAFYSQLLTRHGVIAQPD